MSTFYLGVHELTWIGRVTVGLFISRERLGRRRRLPLPAARGPLALDLGGFTRLSLHGSWEGVTDTQVVADARRVRDECGRLDFAPPKDWMCEPHVLQKTGKTIAEHQRLTVESYVALHSAAPDLPWAPVLQGWGLDDYLRCVELYDRAGVDLWASAEQGLPVVGVGTICRRQGTREAVQILQHLDGLGLRLHGFGLKIEGLARVAPLLQSADSMAWSSAGRRAWPGLPGSCANCILYALSWRRATIASARRGDARGAQLALPLGRAA